MKKIKLKELLSEKKNKGLWANIHAKRKRGESPAKPGDKDYPKTLDIDEDYSNSKWEVYVADDPYGSFMIQADASVTAGDINSQNFEVTLGSGSTVTGNSGFGIKAASRATATKAVRPIAIIDEPGNALTGTDGAFPKLEVKIVQHWMKRQATA